MAQLKYVILLEVDNDTQAMVNDFKKQLLIQHGSDSHLKSKDFIKVCEFTGSEENLFNIKYSLNKFIGSLAPFKVDLDHFQSEIDTVFSVGTSEESKEDLKKIAEGIEAIIPMQNISKNENPVIHLHSSLNSEKCKMAASLFQEVYMYIICDKLHLEIESHSNKQNKEKHIFNLEAKMGFFE